VHHPERAEEGAEPDAGAGPQQGGQRGEIEDGVPGQQRHIIEFRHGESLLVLRRSVILEIAAATSSALIRTKPLIIPGIAAPR